MKGKEDIRDSIERLRKERRAIILAHNYQLPEIQDCADFVGDSLELALEAGKTTAPVIVLCGVDFMAETARILNPGRTVLLPVQDATCPLAAFLTPDMIREARRAHPGAPVVLYVNSTAACKAESDCTCTSANAVKVVRELAAGGEVLLGPDANLAAYVQRMLPATRVIPLPPGGHCYVHTGFSARDIEEARRRGGGIIAHPECPPEVQCAADHVASTSGMIREAAKGDRWTILTEREMGYRLRRLHPTRSFFVREDAVCAEMKKTTLRDLCLALRDCRFRVDLPEDILRRAATPVARMLEIGR